MKRAICLRINATFNLLILITCYSNFSLLQNLTYLVLKHNLSSPYSVPDILLVAVRIALFSNNNEDNYQHHCLCCQDGVSRSLPFPGYDLGRVPLGSTVSTATSLG